MASRETNIPPPEDDEIKNVISRAIGMLVSGLGRGDRLELPAVQARGLDREPDPQRVLEEKGILPQQAEKRTRFSERISRTIPPRSYQRDALTEASAFAHGKEERTKDELPARMDAWRFYLGLPQEHGTFSVSNYVPPNAKEPNVKYYEIEGFLDNLETYGTAVADPRGSSTSNWLKRDTREHIVAPKGEVFPKLVKRVQEEGGRLLVSDNASSVMGNYTVGLGEDEKGPYLSYYDKWDLDLDQVFSPHSRGLPQVVGEKVVERIGQPFEVYGRIYYNPETLKPVEVSRKQDGE